MLDRVEDGVELLSEVQSLPSIACENTYIDRQSAVDVTLGVFEKRLVSDNASSWDAWSLTSV